MSRTGHGSDSSDKKAAGKLNVLVIDDDLTFRESYLFKFEREGFGVVLARSGQEGLKSAREERPSVILLDLLMPDMSGLDVLKKLKEDPETAGIPVVMATVVGETAPMEQGLALGAKQYITKASMTPDSIVKIIRDAATSG
jgi:CheY-like chemotaxis protein